MTLEKPDQSMLSKEVTIKAAKPDRPGIPYSWRNRNVGTQATELLPVSSIQENRSADSMYTVRFLYAKAGMIRLIPALHHSFSR